MSIKKVIKLMENVRRVAEEGGLKDDELRDLTGEYGEEIQQRLIDGFYGGYDIEGKTFKSLKPSTLSIRRSRGNNDDSILLDRRGGIREFLQSDNLIKASKVQIRLNEPPDEYMTHQNEGFSPTGGFLPGRTVPARKWYGIPKTYREGGTKYNEFLKNFVKRIEKNFAEAIKSG